jgi:KUP system potassium uptake protein
VLHERIVILTARTTQTPRVDEQNRIHVEPLSDGFWRATVSFGFMEEPNIPNALRQIRDARLKLDPNALTYFLGRETLIPVKRVHHMALWREKLFVTMSKNAMTATNYFSLPPERVVELGAQLEI